MESGSALEELQEALQRRNALNAELAAELGVSEPSEVWDTPLPSARGSTNHSSAATQPKTANKSHSSKDTAGGIGLQAALQQDRERSLQVQQNLAAAAAESRKLEEDRKKRALQLQQLEAAWRREEEQRRSGADFDESDRTAIDTSQDINLPPSCSIFSPASDSHTSCTITMRQSRHTIHCNNKLQALTGIGAFRSLQALQLDGNQLTTLTGLELLTNLRKLDVSHNKLTRLDATLSPELLHLNATGNQLASLGKGLRGCSKLERLMLARNCLTSLSGLETCTGLQTIAVNSNRLTSLQGIPPCPLLYSINADSNALTIFPQGVLSPLLRTLLLASNKITLVPPLSPLPLLQRLDLRENSISIITPLHSCPHLLLLDLAFNRLNGLQHLEALCPLRSLQQLHLVGNDIENQPGYAEARWGMAAAQVQDSSRLDAMGRCKGWPGGEERWREGVPWLLPLAQLGGWTGACPDVVGDASGSCESFLEAARRGLLCKAHRQLVQLPLSSHQNFSLPSKEYAARVKAAQHSAAAQIQAVYRGWATRQRLTRQLAGHQAAAATRIQAAVRGWAIRKALSAIRKAAHDSVYDGDSSRVPLSYREIPLDFLPVLDALSTPRYNLSSHKSAAKEQSASMMDATSIASVMQDWSFREASTAQAFARAAQRQVLQANKARRRKALQDPQVRLNAFRQQLYTVPPVLPPQLRRPAKLRALSSSGSSTFGKAPPLQPGSSTATTRHTHTGGTGRRSTMEEQTKRVHAHTSRYGMLKI
ncbi:hypothetical protein WJX73_007331 [Symbiochloris irregularis]|uniref:Uncharacterized protein n=1 Tax=Symbiochloris irregularis TaxID=706552 RepID=A0AAW1Q0A8_9CHLO